MPPTTMQSTHHSLSSRERTASSRAFSLKTGSHQRGWGKQEMLLTESNHCSTNFNIYFESLYVKNLRMRIQLTLTANTYYSIQ